MGIFDFFKKKSDKDELDPLSDLTLAKMRKGYFVDYDLKTWEVISSSYYDWGEGDKSYEWQLKSSDDIIYLELEVDDEEYWCISRKITTRALGSEIFDSIIEDEDPPEEIVYENTKFHLDESGGGLYHLDSTGQGRELFKWDYTDNSEKKILTIEQWGESEFEASYGDVVEEYQFTNILPSS